MGLTKEELLDIKNVKLLREIKSVFETKNELKCLADYLYDSYKLINRCQIESSEAGDNLNPTYHSTKMLIDIIEMIKKGELILKDDNCSLLYCDCRYETTRKGIKTKVIECDNCKKN